MKYIQRIYLRQAQKCMRTDIIILCSLAFKIRTKLKTFNSRLSERKVLKNPTLQGTLKLEHSYTCPTTPSSVIVQ